MTDWHDETFELDTVLKRLEDPEPAERTEALRLLVKNAPETAVAVLERLLFDDPERSIRRLAATELERLKEVRANEDTPQDGAGKVEAQDHDEEAGPAPFTMRKGPLPGVPKELRFVIALDWFFAAVFGVYALLHILWPLLAGPDVRFYGSPVRFAADSTAYNLLAAVMCYAAAKDFGTQGLPGSVIQFFAALLVLLSFPAGPVAGSYMIYKVLRPVTKQKS